MGEARTLCVFDAALAPVGDQDRSLVEPGREGMLQPFPAHVSPADRLANHPPSLIDGRGDAYLVPAQTTPAILGTPFVRMVPEPVPAVVGHDIRIVLLHAEVQCPLLVSLEARRKVELILLDHSLEDPSLLRIGHLAEELHPPSVGRGQRDAAFLRQYAQRVAAQHPFHEGIPRLSGCGAPLGQPAGAQAEEGPASLAAEPSLALRRAVLHHLPAAASWTAWDFPCRSGLLPCCLDRGLGFPRRRQAVLLDQGVHDVDDLDLLGNILEGVDQLLVDFQSLLLFFLVCHGSIVAEVWRPVYRIHLVIRKEPLSIPSKK